MPSSVSSLPCSVCGLPFKSAKRAAHRGCIQQTAKLKFDDGAQHLAARETNGQLRCPRCSRLDFNARLLIVSTRRFLSKSLTHPPNTGSLHCVQTFWTTHWRPCCCSTAHFIFHDVCFFLFSPCSSIQRWAHFIFHVFFFQPMFVDTKVGTFYFSCMFSFSFSPCSSIRRWAHFVFHGVCFSSRPCSSIRRWAHYFIFHVCFSSSPCSSIWRWAQFIFHVWCSSFSPVFVNTKMGTLYFRYVFGSAGVRRYEGGHILFSMYVFRSAGVRRYEGGHILFSMYVFRSAGVRQYQGGHILFFLYVFLQQL